MYQNAYSAYINNKLYSGMCEKNTSMLQVCRELREDFLV